MHPIWMVSAWLWYAGHVGGSEDQLDGTFLSWTTQDRLISPVSAANGGLFIACLGYTESMLGDARRPWAGIVVFPPHISAWLVPLQSTSNTYHSIRTDLACAVQMPWSDQCCGSNIRERKEIKTERRSFALWWFSNFRSSSFYPWQI